MCAIMTDYDCIFILGVNRWMLTGLGYCCSCGMCDGISMYEFEKGWVFLMIGEYIDLNVYNSKYCTLMQSQFIIIHSSS